MIYDYRDPKKLESSYKACFYSFIGMVVMIIITLIYYKCIR